MSSQARTLAKVMHQFMVKSSTGVFRVRFVVPVFDWPTILENDGNQYDTVSAMIDDNAARTRFGAGVLVMELAGPRTTDRLLCVNATTSMMFVDVLFRLLSGLADDSDNVIARMLVDPMDFEMASTINGRGGIVETLSGLRSSMSVDIEDELEQFHDYPMADEMAIRIIGRPSSVVQCVCLINEMLGETITLTASHLVEEQLRSARISASDWEGLGFQSTGLARSALFENLLNQNSPSSPIETAHRPVSDPRPYRPTTPNWGFMEYDMNEYSPESPTETTAGFRIFDARFSNTLSGNSRLSENQNRPLRSLVNRPITSIRREWLPANGYLGPQNVTTTATTTTTTTTTATTATTATDTTDTTGTTKKATSVQSDTDRPINRNQPLRPVTIRPPSAVRFFPNSQNRSRVNRNPPSRVRFSGITTARSAPGAPTAPTTDRHTTSTWSVSDRLVNCRNPSSRATTNSTSAISVETGRSSDTTIGESVTTDNNTVTNQHATSPLNPFDQFDMSYQTST